MENKVEVVISVDTKQITKDLNDLARLTKLYPEMTEGLLQMVKKNIVIKERMEV